MRPDSELFFLHWDQAGAEKDRKMQDATGYDTLSNSWHPDSGMKNTEPWLDGLEAIPDGLSFYPGKQFRCFYVRDVLSNPPPL